MKIYTKTGDKGSTGLIGGPRVEKDDIRLEAYGTADELNSHLGVMRANIDFDDVKKDIHRVQNFLFDIGSYLATDAEKLTPFLSKEVVGQEINWLENKIDSMNATLPILNKFIIPAGSVSSTYCHVCRCVCRRLERRIYETSKHYPVMEEILIYVNRLSDFLFILSRYVAFLLKEEVFFRE